MSILEWFVLGFAWLCGLNVLVFGVLLIVWTLREPPRWWVRWRIPDYYDPNDWSPKGSDAKANRP